MIQPDLPEFEVPKFLAVAWAKLVDWLRWQRVVAGSGIDISDAVGGGKLIALANDTGGSGARVTPWTVQRASSTTVKVSANSILKDTADVNSVFNVTDLDGDFEVDVGQVLFLEIVYLDGFNIDTITLKSDDVWDDYPTPYKLIGSGTLMDPFRLDRSYYVVGFGVAEGLLPAFEGPTIANDDNDKVRVIRTTFGPLMIALVNLGGGFIGPYPAPGVIPVQI